MEAATRVNEAMAFDKGHGHVRPVWQRHGPVFGNADKGHATFRFLHDVAAATVVWGYYSKRLAVVWLLG